MGWGEAPATTPTNEHQRAMSAAVDLATAVRVWMDKPTTGNAARMVEAERRFTTIANQVSL